MMQTEEIAKSRLNTENGTEIISVGDFLVKINKLQENTEDYAQKYFFRGQQVEFWDISSSIFREGMLNVEHQLLKEPLEKFPNEFKNLDNTFDLMTKCQHYGLCTRLLDVTTNPLVALYFACQKYGEQKYVKDPEDDSNKEHENLEPWGMIFYKKDYPIYSDDKKVKIITELAKYNLQYENSLNKILKKLQKENIITTKEAKDWSETKYNDFINIIQSTYIVQPTHNNSRIVAQSGAFLLPGMFSFKKNNLINSVITKCKGNLKKEFENNFFYIKGENKKRILEELNVCNINESTLFPELEHQLRHIKTLNMQKAFDAPLFEKYTEILEETPNTYNETLANLHFDRENEAIEKFKLRLKKYIYSNPKFKNKEEALYQKITKNLVIDWYKKESVKSKIRLETTKVLIEKNIEKKYAITFAQELLDNILKIYIDILNKQQKK